jgi:tetratricopeptide (TPR) repeat protein
MNARVKHRRSIVILDPQERARGLERRALRYARRGDVRKAIVLLRQAANLGDIARVWVRLGYVLSRDGRIPDALEALRRALWLHRRSGCVGRARTVAQLILAIDPSCPFAARAAEDLAAA